MVSDMTMSRSILDYFQVKYGLLDPLSSQIPSQAIALANKEVQHML